MGVGDGVVRGEDGRNHWCRNRSITSSPSYSLLILGLTLHTRMARVKRPQLTAPCEVSEGKHDW